MKTKSMYTVAFAVAATFAMLALCAAPAAADANVGRTIDAAGTAKTGKGNGNGKIYQADFDFYYHTSIPGPIPEAGLAAYIVVDGVQYVKNVTDWTMDEATGIASVTFIGGETLTGTATNFVVVPLYDSAYRTTADITLGGVVTLNNKPYTFDLDGTYTVTVWPLTPGSGID